MERVLLTLILVMVFAVENSRAESLVFLEPHSVCSTLLTSGLPLIPDPEELKGMPTEELFESALSEKELIFQQLEKIGKKSGEFYEIHLVSPSVMSFLLGVEDLLLAHKIPKQFLSRKDELLYTSLREIFPDKDGLRSYFMSHPNDFVEILELQIENLRNLQKELKNRRDTLSQEEQIQFKKLTEWGQSISVRVVEFTVSPDAAWKVEDNSLGDPLLYVSYPPNIVKGTLVTSKSMFHNLLKSN